MGADDDEAAADNLVKDLRAAADNIILGGGIGWAIDSASGADNKYTSPVNLTLVPLDAPAPAPTHSHPPEPKSEGTPTS